MFKMLHERKVDILACAQYQLAVSMKVMWAQLGGGGGGTSVNFVLLKFKYGKGRPLLSSTPIPCLCVNVRYCCGDVFFAWRIFFSSTYRLPYGLQTFG